jgi:hypothetical protein
MANLVGHLAKRGVQAAHRHLSENPKPIQLSTGANILLGLTFLTFFLFGSSIEYTIRIVMGHLAMIESPESTKVQIFTPTSSNSDLDKKDAESQDLLEVELEASTVTSTKPITTSIRRTARHLKSIGGCTAKWRGLGIFIVYSFVTHFIAGGLNLLIMRAIPFGETISNIAACLLASRLHCAFTHKLISMPSSKKLWERRVSRAQWKQLLAPTAMSILARDMSIRTIVSVFVISSKAARSLSSSGKAPAWVAPILAIAPGLITSVSLSIFVMLPAYAALVRKEASLLPEDEDTIVSFDRTFNGKLAHVSDTLSYKDAWKSFNSEARGRVIKLYTKFFFIMAAFVFIMIHVVGFELYMVAGDQVKQYAVAAGANLRARGF